MALPGKIEAIQKRYDDGKMSKAIYDALMKKYGGKVTKPADYVNKGQRERFKAEEEEGVYRGPGAWGRK